MEKFILFIAYITILIILYFVGLFITLDWWWWYSTILGRILTLFLFSVITWAFIDTLKDY